MRAGVVSAQRHDELKVALVGVRFASFTHVVGCRFAEV